MHTITVVTVARSRRLFAKGRMGHLPPVPRHNGDVNKYIKPQSHHTVSFTVRPPVTTKRHFVLANTVSNRKLTARDSPVPKRRLPVIPTPIAHRRRPSPHRVPHNRMNVKQDGGYPDNVTLPRHVTGTRQHRRHNPQVIHVPTQPSRTFRHNNRRITITAKVAGHLPQQDGTIIHDNRHNRINVATNMGRNGRQEFGQHMFMIFLPIRTKNPIRRINRNSHQIVIRH